MNKFVIIIISLFITFVTNAQIQTKFWDLTLGYSSYKQVEKYCKQFRGHYKDEYENFWGSRSRTIDNESNNDPLKGEVFIRPFNLINFAGDDWKVTFTFHDNKLCSVQMRLSRYDKESYQDLRGRTHITNKPMTIFKRPSQDYLQTLIESLLNKYQNFFQPDESKENSSYIFFDGKTHCELQLTKDGRLYLTYTDNSLSNLNQQSLFNEL